MLPAFGPLLEFEFDPLEVPEESLLLQPAKEKINAPHPKRLVIFSIMLLFPIIQVPPFILGNRFLKYYCTKKALTSQCLFVSSILKKIRKRKRLYSVFLFHGTRRSSGIEFTRNLNLGDRGFIITQLRDETLGKSFADGFRILMDARQFR